VSETLSERRLRHGSADASGALDGVAPGGVSTLHVRAVFRDVDEQHAESLAAEMIARAHELANNPECECDVDVSVQCTASPALLGGEGPDAQDPSAARSRC
jgi:hypothetical protein